MDSSAQKEWRDNWGLILAATIGIAVAGIHYHVVGALVKPLESAYGWSRGDVTLALTISSALSPFTNVIVGWLADRFGPRRVMLISIPLFGISFALLGFTGIAVLAWHIGYGLFAVIGHGTSPVVWTMAVVQKFSASRGLALAVSLSGAGVLVSIMPGIIYWLVDNVGVQTTFFVLGGAAILAMFPTAYLFLPRRSEVTQTHAERQAASDALPGHTVEQALRQMRFWRLAVAFLIVSTCVGTFIVHIQPMLTDSGMNRSQAATVALFIGPSMIFGRIVTGLLFDRIEPRIVATAAFLIPALACLMLLQLNDSVTYGAATAIVIGLGMGAEVDVLAYITSRYFGLKRYGVLFGLLIGLYGIGVGLGSAIGGYVYDQTGSYDGLLLSLTGLIVFAAANIAALGPAPGFARVTHSPAVPEKA